MQGAGDLVSCINTLEAMINVKYLHTQATSGDLSVFGSLAIILAEHLASSISRESKIKMGASQHIPLTNSRYDNISVINIRTQFQISLAGSEIELWKE